MKAILSLLTTLFGYIGTIICGIWTIVEFLIYLVKDTPFNWHSFWSTIICILVMLISFALSIIFSIKDR